MLPQKLPHRESTSATSYPEPFDSVCPDTIYVLAKNQSLFVIYIHSHLPKQVCGSKGAKLAIVCDDIDELCRPFLQERRSQ